MNLQIWKTYLFTKTSYSSTVEEIKIVGISTKAYKIKFPNGHERWERKEDFEYEYRMLEDITRQEPFTSITKE